jgi:small conductance mechanosensitive channel
VDEARETLLRAVEAIPGVLRDPRPGVVVQSLADSGIHLLIRVWIADGEEETRVTFAVREACKAALDAAGIEIPYPHRHVVVRSAGRIGSHESEGRTS